jgi:hypothetical protein
MTLKKWVMDLARALVMDLVRELVRGRFLVVAMVLVRGLKVQAVGLVMGRSQDVT